jgi:hypothetical protein
MHTGHIVLVKAESHEDAIGIVWTTVNTSDENWFASNWSDWAVVADEGISGSRYQMADFFEEDTYTGTHPHALSLETESELFYQLVSKKLEEREATFDAVVNKLKEEGVDSLYDFRLDQDDDVSWYLRRLSNLVGSVYTHDSKIFDLENHDANLSYFKKDVEAGNTNWYAVVVDFHF